LSCLTDYRFSERVFRPSPALRSLTPVDGCFIERAYRGQRYNMAKWTVVPDAWNHEHCTLCSSSIDPGDTYWGTRRDAIVLCSDCHVAFRVRIERKARQQVLASRRARRTPMRT
jgi:hypothetical protein